MFISQMIKFNSKKPGGLNRGLPNSRGAKVPLAPSNGASGKDNLYLLTSKKQKWKWKSKNGTITSFNPQLVSVNKFVGSFDVNSILLYIPPAFELLLERLQQSSLDEGILLFPFGKSIYILSCLLLVKISSPSCK